MVCPPTHSPPLQAEFVPWLWAPWLSNRCLWWTRRGDSCFNARTGRLLHGW